MSKSQYDCVAEASQLATVRGKRALLAGRAVFASMNATTPEPEGYLAQPYRDVSADILASFRKNQPKVRVAVHPELVHQNKVRFALAIDGYLAWGHRRRKGVVALLGGIEQAEEDFVIDVMVFDDGELVDLFSRELPPVSASLFKDAVKTIVNDLKFRYPEASLYQASPLSDWGLQGVEYIGDKPLRRLTYRPLAKSTSSKAEYLVPAAVVGLGMLVGGYFLAEGFGQYTRSQSAYMAAAADPAMKEKGGIDTDFLNMMQQRRFFIEAPRKQEILAEKAALFVQGIAAVPDVQILELKLPAPSVVPQNQVGIAPQGDDKSRNLITADRSPDVSIRISVPLPPGSKLAMEQAETVLRTISQRTGLSLNLARQPDGWKDAGGRRIFTIEGFIHG